MKLTHNIKSPRPLKNLGLNQKLYDNNEKQMNINLTPNKVTLETTELNLGSSRSSNIKVAPFGSHFTYSQVIDRNHQYVLRPERDQIERISIAQNNGSNHDLIALRQDISSLKQIMHNPMGSANFLQMKEQIMQQVSLIIEEHKVQSAQSLREALLKIDGNLKKQCIIHLSRQFLPLSFLDDSESKFQQFQNRISRVQGALSEYHMKQTIKPFQQQLKKHEVQTYEIKSLIKQLQESFKINKQNVLTNNKHIGCIANDNIEQKVEHINKAAADLEKQLKDISQTMHNVKLDQERTNARLKFLQQTTNNSLTLQQQYLKQNRTQKSKGDKKQFKSESIPPNQNYYRVTQGNNSNLAPYKSMSLTFSMESLGDLLKPQPTTIPGSIGSIKDIKSSKYILDNDNNLMDDTGNYILNEDGNQIKLTEQQLQMIRESNVLKYKQY